jgi:tight adherence protein C
MILGIATGAAMVILFGVWGLKLYTDGDRVTGSAEGELEAKKQKKSSVFPLDPIADVIGRPFAGIASDLLAPRRSKLRARIDAAGRPGGMTVESYSRQTAGYVVLFGTLSVFFFLSGSILMGVVCLLGCLQKEAVLYSRAQSRQDHIERTLPDFLDVLAVTVSAGLSFRHALARVLESMPGPLADELNVALRQMDLGTSRREAFEDLRSRNKSPALDEFVTALLQAEELGAPLVTALTDISVDMRKQSATWAKRKAQRITPRITAVSTSLTLPALILIVLGAMYFGSGTDLGGAFSAR